MVYSSFWYLLAVVLIGGRLRSLAPLFPSLCGLLAGLTLLKGPPLRYLVLFGMPGMCIGRRLMLAHLILRWLFVMLLLGLVWMMSGVFGAGVLRLAFLAYCIAGGPTAAGSFAFLGRGMLRIRNRRLGGRAVGRGGASRLYRVSHSDEVDVQSAQYVVNSSLARVLLFRRRLKSVADVLKGIRNSGFTQSRWEAQLRYWDAVCRHGPCGPICSLHPWDEWVPPDLHGFLNGSLILLRC